jgi:hypothetical protein
MGELSGYINWQAGALDSKKIEEKHDARNENTSLARAIRLVRFGEFESSIRTCICIRATRCVRLSQTSTTWISERAALVQIVKEGKAKIVALCMYGL